MAGIIKPPPISGVIGLPAGQKEAGKRVDFKKDQFAFLIETKGYRIAWARGCLCPCKSPDTQSQQPKRDCSICAGSGFLYFRPKDYVVNESTLGDLTDVQKGILSKNHAVVIRAVVTSVARNVEAYDKMGSWMFGSALCTVRHENRLGYYDKITFVDSVAANTQIVEVTDITQPLPLHWPVVDVNLLIDESGTRYISGQDFSLSSAGEICWLPNKAPPLGQVAVHFHYHPTFLVMEHSHLVRESILKFKQATDSLQTPMGDHQPLPIQAMIKLDHLVAQEGAEV